jgi:hypothetical protein
VSFDYDTGDGIVGLLTRGAIAVVVSMGASFLKVDCKRCNYDEQFCNRKDDHHGRPRDRADAATAVV